jgi:hypothetical protein
MQWNILLVTGRRLLLLILLCAFSAGQTARAQSQDQSDVERQIKAAYLYKFGSYIEWPDRAFASAASPLQIGVMGADALADELAQITVGRTIGGRQVTVRKLRRDDPVTGLNVLFIGRSHGARVAEIVATAKGQPMLTVTESEDALSAGSMINFVVVDGKVRFEVATRPAGQGHLSISARLLAAAYKVMAGAS